MEITDKFRYQVIFGICLLLEQGLLSKVDEVTESLVYLRGDTDTYLRMYL